MPRKYDDICVEEPDKNFQYVLLKDIVKELTIDKKVLIQLAKIQKITVVRIASNLYIKEDKSFFKEFPEIKRKRNKKNKKKVSLSNGITYYGWIGEYIALNSDYWY